MEKILFSPNRPEDEQKKDILIVKNSYQPRESLSWNGEAFVKPADSDYDPEKEQWLKQQQEAELSDLQEAYQLGMMESDEYKIRSEMITNKYKYQQEAPRQKATQQEIPQQELTQDLNEEYRDWLESHQNRTANPMEIFDQDKARQDYEAQASAETLQDSIELRGDNLSFKLKDLAKISGFMQQHGVLDSETYRVFSQIEQLNADASLDPEMEITLDLSDPESVVTDMALTAAERVVTQAASSPAEKNGRFANWLKKFNFQPFRHLKKAVAVILISTGLFGASGGNSVANKDSEDFKQHSLANQQTAVETIYNQSDANTQAEASKMVFEESYDEYESRQFAHEKHQAGDQIEFNQTAYEAIQAKRSGKHAEMHLGADIKEAIIERGMELNTDNVIKLIKEDIYNNPKSLAGLLIGSSLKIDGREVKVTDNNASEIFNRLKTDPKLYGQAYDRVAYWMDKAIKSELKHTDGRAMSKYAIERGGKIIYGTSTYGNAADDIIVITKENGKKIEIKLGCVQLNGEMEVGILIPPYKDEEKPPEDDGETPVIPPEEQQKPPKEEEIPPVKDLFEEPEPEPEPEPKVPQSETPERTPEPEPEPEPESERPPVTPPTTPPVTPPVAPPENPPVAPPETPPAKPPVAPPPVTPTLEAKDFSKLPDNNPAVNSPGKASGENLQAAGQLKPETPSTKQTVAEQITEQQAGEQRVEQATKQQTEQNIKQEQQVINKVNEQNLNNKSEDKSRIIESQTPNLNKQVEIKHEVVKEQAGQAEAGINPKIEKRPVDSQEIYNQIKDLKEAGVSPNEITVETDKDGNMTISAPGANSGKVEMP